MTFTAQREDDLAYCYSVLLPEALRLEAEQLACIGRPWRYVRWLRAYRAHRAVNAEWRAILEGRAHRP